MSTSNGKKPLSQKQGSKPSFNLGEIFTNRLAVDGELAKAIEAKGQVYRWINATKLREFGGVHEMGWMPAKRSDYVTIDASHDSIIYGNSPDGFIRRGDCILAVRSKELNAEHKRYLKHEAEGKARSARSSAQADELRRYAKEIGLDTVVEDGFGDDDDEN